jgi:DNA-binding transcriptional LysR family regulator
VRAAAQAPRRAGARPGQNTGQNEANRIDLNLLRVALAVEDCGSVTQAAGILGCSQSAVSMGLRRLRTAIGDPLFVRGPKGMMPTPRAVRLLATARPLLAQVDGGLLQEEQFDPAATRTRFTFAMSDVGEIVFLPRLLERIHADAPRATVRTVTVKPRELERSLEHGDIDLAIGYFPDLRGKSFREQRLFAHSFSCLVRARHPVLRSGLTRERLLALEHAAVQPEGRSQEIFERFLVQHRIERRVVLTTPHFMSLPMIIARSDLIATVPHVIGLFFTRWSEGIRAVAPPFRLPPIVVKQHWHQRYRQDRRHRWLRGVVAELFTDESDEWRR